MPRTFQGFPWRLALTFITICYLCADIFAFKGPLHDWLLHRTGQGGGTVAEVCGTPISRQELADALREHLWKRHETWASLDPDARREARSLVLENLVNDRLLRSSRRLDAFNADATTAAVKLETERLQRQFAEASEFPSRLAAQQLTPQSLQARVQEAQFDEAWLSKKTQPRINELTPQDLRAWYDESKETLRIPQAWHAAHIFLTRHDETKPDRAAEIREIHRQLLAKEKTFAQLAKAHSEDARSQLLGGDLGWFTSERMPPDFIAALQQLKLGQVSQPVQTRLGWHLILVLERHVSRLPSFAEVKDEIAARLISKRREEALKSLLAELRSQSPPPVSCHAEAIDRTEPAP